MTEPWIQTYTGRKFVPLNPRPRDVDIIDIAHALSLQCRFLGHVKTFYSVAEHSVRVSWLFEPMTRLVQLAGLLHDAAETYLADVSSPVKQTMPEYQIAEELVLDAVGFKFGIDFHANQDLIKWADLTLLSTELRDLLGPPPEPWSDMPPPLPETIVPWSSVEAEARFLARFYELERQP